MELKKQKLTYSYLLFLLLKVSFLKQRTYLAFSAYYLYFLRLEIVIRNFALNFCYLLKAAETVSGDPEDKSSAYRKMKSQFTDTADYRRNGFVNLVLQCYYLWCLKKNRTLRSFR